MSGAVIAGEFCTFRHIKTRKTFVIEIEFPEERGQEVLRVLGMPIGGESKPVAVALLDSSSSNGRTAPFEGVNRGSNPREETTEGERLRTRAALLCKSLDFQIYCNEKYDVQSSEEGVKGLVRHYCNINSRSEIATNEAAQKKFQELDYQFKNWLFERQHKDNLSKF